MVKSPVGNCVCERTIMIVSVQTLVRIGNASGIGCADALKGSTHLVQETVQSPAVDCRPEMMQPPEALHLVYSTCPRHV